MKGIKGGLEVELGLIGLGRMGLNMALRLKRAGHRVIGYAHHVKTVDNFVSEVGAEGAYSPGELAEKLRPPRTVWIMIPAGGAVDEVIGELLPKLSADDVVVDGGNSNYKDSVRRASMLREKGIRFLDVGTSGGIWGLKEGYCMMIGGEKEAVDRLRPVFEALAPAADKGWAHVGPSGAGHFVKMVHNGIEYGLMEAYGEGFALLKQKEEFRLDLHQIAEVWRYGSVVRSWLLDLTADALAKDAELKDVEPFVEDSGEGRWTVKEAIDLNVSAPIITLSLLERLRSRDRLLFSDRLLAVMRNQFGGHKIKREEQHDE